MKKISITVGIPAYNEGANIGALLENLLRQKTKGLKLENILVSSDGSTDDTVRIARKFKGGMVKVTDGKKRLGKAARQNQIIESVNSNILVILDADIVPAGLDFLEKLVKPIVNGRADLVSVPRIPNPPSTFIEKVIYVSVTFKRKVFEKYYRNGQNIYTCNGSARAFSRNFYQNFRFPYTYGEDAYSYLYCITHGYTYRFEKGTGVIYKLPDNIHDHKKQSVRFFKSLSRMEKYFGKEVVKKEYKIPFKETVKVFIEIFRKNPLEIILYIFVVSIMKLNAIFSKQISPLWDISKSSKENITVNRVGLKFQK